MQIRKLVSNLVENLNENLDASGAQLVEFFDSPSASLGALAFAGHSVQMQQHPYQQQPQFDANPSMPDYNKAMLNLMNEVMQMLQRAHIRANQELQPIGVRYEIKGAIPLNNLQHLTTTLPDMININIELRDVAFPRRLTQVVRYRISTSLKNKQISLRIMDSKVQIYPPKAIFHLHLETQNFDIAKFESRLVPKLIDRARSAFKRSDNESSNNSRSF